MKSTEIWLEYHLPMLGTVEAKLYPLATKCYQLLNRNGHIERLKKINQLGVIREIYEGAHHSRWEYVMAQLALIYRLTQLENKTKVQGAGLSTGLNEFKDLGVNEKPPSGAEIMQCWTLLLNSGHLNGTFATEAGLMQSFLEDKKLCNTFLKGLDCEDVKEYARRIIKKNEVYSFHKAIAFFYLYRHRRGKQKDIAKGLIRILKYYCGLERLVNGAEKKRERLNRIYSRIRQICYLSLDSLYSPTPMRLDLSSVFLNLEKRSGDICEPTDSSFCRELDGFNKLMTDEVYCSKMVLLQSERQKQHIARKVKEWYSDGLLEKKEIKREKITDMHRILKTLQNKHFRPTGVQEKDYKFILSFSMGSMTVQKIAKDTNKISDVFRKNISNKNICVSVLRDASDKETYIAVGISKKLNVGSILRIFARMGKAITKLSQEIYLNSDFGSYFRQLEKRKNGRRKNIFHFMLMYNPIFQHWCPEYIENLLCSICEGCRFKIDRSSHGLFGFVARGTKQNCQMINLEAEEMLESSRKHELKTHSCVLESIKYKGSVISCLAPIQVKNKKGVDVTDIDGLSVLVKDDVISLLIVEAKDMHKGSQTEAEKQLKDSMQKMGLSQYLSDPKIKQICGKGAYIFSELKSR